MLDEFEKLCPEAKEALKSGTITREYALQLMKLPKNDQDMLMSRAEIRARLEAIRRTR